MMSTLNELEEELNDVTEQQRKHMDISNNSSHRHTGYALQRLAIVVEMNFRIRERERNNGWERI